MKPYLALLPLLLVLVAAAVRGGAAPAPESGPVVVELFTSQGCSSCPPADQLLSRLTRDPKLAGRVIPLAFHVDYWNHIGWQDPFSSPRWSERQKAYGRAFHSNRIYTPQLVVGGRTDCVGSKETEVRNKIGAALAEAPAGRVTLVVQPPGPNGRMALKVGAKLARAAGPRDLDLWVAVYQTGLTTPVGSGENAAKTLHNDYVVRRLEKAFTVPGAAGAERSSSLIVNLDKGWKVADLGVAAFLQDPQTLAIHGAVAKALRAK